MNLALNSSLSFLSFMILVKISLNSTGFHAAQAKNASASSIEGLYSSFIIDSSLLCVIMWITYCRVSKLGHSDSLLTDKLIASMAS